MKVGAKDAAWRITRKDRGGFTMMVYETGKNKPFGVVATGYAGASRSLVTGEVYDVNHRKMAERDFNSIDSAKVWVQSSVDKASASDSLPLPVKVTRDAR